MFEPELSELKFEAFAYECKHNQEFCMSHNEINFMMNVRRKLGSEVLLSNKLSHESYAAVASIHKKIGHLKIRWLSHNRIAEEYGLETKCPRHRAIFLEQYTRRINQSPAPTVDTSNFRGATSDQTLFERDPCLSSRSRQSEVVESRRLRVEVKAEPELKENFMNLNRNAFDLISSAAVRFDQARSESVEDSSLDRLLATLDQNDFSSTKSVENFFNDLLANAIKKQNELATSSNVHASVTSDKRYQKKASEVSLVGSSQAWSQANNSVKISANEPTIDDVELKMLQLHKAQNIDDFVMSDSDFNSTIEFLEHFINNKCLHFFSDLDSDSSPNGKFWNSLSFSIEMNNLSQFWS